MGQITILEQLKEKDPKEKNRTKMEDSNQFKEKCYKIRSQKTGEKNKKVELEEKPKGLGCLQVRTWGC